VEEQEGVDEVGAVHIVVHLLAVVAKTVYGSPVTVHFRKPCSWAPGWSGPVRLPARKQTVGMSK
jgi:hypothetical protein